MARDSGCAEAYLSRSRERLSLGFSPIYPRLLLLAALHKSFRCKRLQEPFPRMWRTSHNLGAKRLDHTPLPAYSFFCRQGMTPSITNRLG